jgi:hypothetical protein
LVPTRVSTDKLPTTIRQLAELLVTTPQYRQELRGGPNPAGTFTPTTFYVQDDQVDYDGSSYVYINAITTRGNYPPNATYWQLVAARGANGTGTSGNNTPYDATTWDGQTDAPSRNAVRDIVETLARSTQLASLAPINNANLTGSPSRSSSPLAGDRSSQLATTQWAGNEFATATNAALTGTPSAPTQATTDVSGKLATTKFVDDYAKARSFSLLVVAQQTIDQTLVSDAYTQINWNTELLDSQNLLTGGVFTAPATGWYRFTAGAYVTSTNNYGGLDLSLFSGASRLTSMFSFFGYAAGGAFIAGKPTTLLLNQAQTINVRAFGGNSTTSPKITVATGIINQLEIERLTLI